jgi:hypothetical protein
MFLNLGTLSTSPRENGRASTCASTGGSLILSLLPTVEEDLEMELKAGLRLKSATDPTEVIVVKTPGGELDLRCGGHPFLPIDASGETPSPVEPGFDGGTLVGKRYGDEELGLELLCTKGGSASISLGDDILSVKTAKALPASD